MERRATLQANELASILESIKEVDEEKTPSISNEPEPKSEDSFEPVQRVEITLEAPETISVVSVKREPISHVTKLDSFKHIVTYSPYVQIALDAHSLQEITKSNES